MTSHAHRGRDIAGNRMPDRIAVDAVARLRAHQATMRPEPGLGKPLRVERAAIPVTLIVNVATRHNGQATAPLRELTPIGSYQHIDNNKAMNQIALITGATRNLGFSLAQELAQRLEPTDTVYLTGRDPARVAASAHRLSNVRADVRAEVLDVAICGAVRA